MGDYSDYLRVPMKMNSKLISVLQLLTILGISTAWLYLLYLFSGKSMPDERISFPTTIEEIQRLSVVLKSYTNESYFYTVVFFSSAYIYKQAFAIPGSIFLNLLSGTLFGVWKGFVLCCILSAAGATSCYLISKYITHGIIQSLFPAKLAKFSKLVKRNEDKLLYFLLSLRIFPMTPNWLVNMASPLVKVPMNYFFISVLFGLMPYNFLTCQAGSMLADIKSVNEVISIRTGVGLSLLAAAILGPTLLTKRRKPRPRES